MSKFSSNGIGIFGGSFDPPHLGHLKISKIALKKLKIKKLYWKITKKNPFKKKPFYSIKARIAKAKNISKNLSKIQVLFIDNKIKSSRTIDVINYLLKVRKMKNLYLILGSDNLITFHKWTSWKKIAKLVKLVIFSRKNYDIKGKKSKVIKYFKKDNLIYIKNKHINISSTNIKKNLKF